MGGGSVAKRGQSAPSSRIRLQRCRPARTCVGEGETGRRVRDLVGLSYGRIAIIKRFANDSALKSHFKCRVQCFRARNLFCLISISIPTFCSIFAVDALTVPRHASTALFAERVSSASANFAKFPGKCTEITLMKRAPAPACCARSRSPPSKYTALPALCPLCRYLIHLSTSHIPPPV